MCFSLAQETVEQPVPRSAHRRSTRQSDRKLDGAVKVSALMIDVIQEPGDIPVPTGFAGAKISTRNTPPLVQQMTSEDDLSADEEVVADSKFCDTFVGGPTSTPLKIAGLTIDLAGYVTVGVASSADHAGDITVGVASSTDLAGDVTVDVVPSADLAGDVTVGVASLADLDGDVTDLAGDITVGVASLADIAEVAPSVDYDGDVTAGATPKGECGNMMCVLIIMSMMTVIAMIRSINCYLQHTISRYMLQEHQLPFQCNL